MKPCFVVQSILAKKLNGFRVRCTMPNMPLVPQKFSKGGKIVPNNGLKALAHSLRVRHHEATVVSNDILSFFEVLSYYKL
jgi:hypothetical protein